MSNLEKYEKDFNEVYHNRNSNLNFMGSILCPLKKKVKNDLEEMLDRIKEERNIEYNCYVADGHGSLTDEYSDYWEIEDIDVFPDIIVSKGIDELYRKKLYDELIAKGYFTNANKDSLDEKFIEAGCLDDSYTMYGAFLDVLLVDEKKMDDTPLPRCWGDLLDSRYRGKIVISEKSGEISAAVALNIYREIGEEGIKRLAENTKATVPGKQIKDIIGKESEESGVIYITSYSSAKSLEGNGNKMVVPEDGAAILPFAMLVKKEKKDELKFLIDYILEEYADSISGLDGISLNKDASDNDIEGIKLKWFGWDFVRENDLVDLNKNIQSLFKQVREEIQ